MTHSAIDDFDHTEGNRVADLVEEYWSKAFPEFPEMDVADWIYDVAWAAYEAGRQAALDSVAKEGL